jgi:parallel beta-helix repeat protein
MRNARSFVSRLIGLSLMLAGMVGSVEATTWNVPTNYGSIQAAINDAAVQSNDIIEVTAPKTEGSFSINNGKNLTIRKIGTGQVLMTNQCNLQGAITARVEGIDVSSVNIGFYIDAASSITVSGCSVNATSGNSAFYITPAASGSLRIVNCTVQYSGASGVDAIQAYGGLTLTLDGTAIIDSGRVGVLMGTTANSTLNVLNGSVIGNNPQFGIWALADNVTVNINDSSVSTNTLSGVYMESTGGVLNMSNSTVNNNAQYGIYLVKGTNATLNDCTLRNNTLMGLYRANNAGQTTTINMTGGTVRNNGSNGGIDILEVATVNLTNVQLLNNTNFGLFLRDRALGPVTLTGCTFAGNTVNSLRTTGQTGASVLRASASKCVFRDGSNNSQPGIFLYNGNTNFKFTNCVFDEGQNQLYGRTDANSTSVSLAAEFCTFVSRSGQSQIAVASFAEAGDAQKIDVRVVNSIISGATTGIYVDGSSANKSVVNNFNLMNAATTQYSGITVAGANDRTGDPKFLVATTGVGTADLRLQGVLPPSPAIDAASLALSPGVTSDILGTSRPLPLGTAADMGAYEEISVPVELTSFEAM